jgi:hypothetical protein
MRQEGEAGGAVGSGHRRTANGTSANVGYFAFGTVLAAVWTILLLGILATVGEGIGHWLAAVSGLILTVSGVYGVVFQQRKFPSIGRRAIRLAVALILCIDLILTLFWLGWYYYQTHRAIDITAQAVLHRNVNVRPGARGGLDVDVRAQRSHIVVVFRIVDYNGDQGSCVPNTRLSVTPSAGGSQGETASISSAEALDLSLAPSAQHVHLDIVVTNTRSDSNCAVNISVSSVKLTT